jgi:cytochrome c553
MPRDSPTPTVLLDALQNAILRYEGAPDQLDAPLELRTGRRLQFVLPEAPRSAEWAAWASGRSECLSRAANRPVPREYGIADNCTGQIEHIMKKLIIASLALLVAGTVSVRAADAKENWKKDCAGCHGENGKPKGKKHGGMDFTNPKVQARMKDADITKAIKQGVKEGDKVEMKPFPNYTDDEVKALVKLIRDFKK